MPIGTIVILPENHNLKGFVTGDSLDLNLEKYFLFYAKIFNNLSVEKMSMETKKEITERLENFKTKKFKEYMYIGKENRNVSS